MLCAREAVPPEDMKYIFASEFTLLYSATYQIHIHWGIVVRVRDNVTLSRTHSRIANGNDA